MECSNRLCVLLHRIAATTKHEKCEIEETNVKLRKIMLPNLDFCIIIH